jgi:carboxypeptidase Q
VDSFAERYRETAGKIVAAALAENDAYRKLEDLCLSIGHRLSGSPQLEKAIDWAIAELKKDGADAVRREKVMVPHWVRGAESAMLTEPRREALHILGLGGSVGTPPEGITAPVLVVADEEDLEKRAGEAAGKIVLFDKPLPPHDAETGSGYWGTVKYRVHGARLAAEKGALACLVRSVTARSLRSPHTGGMTYGESARKIPAAAVSVEDAELLARLQARGARPVVQLKMEARTLPDAESANVIGELRGSSLPDEVVVIGGHIDSWDVGHGAHDDGGGCVIAMETIRLLRKLGLVPRRTIRVVLWTNEENGFAGAKAYAEGHAAELERHVAAIESDNGVFQPAGYSVECLDRGREAIAAKQMEEIVGLFPSSIGPLKATVGHSGADVSLLEPAGVMLLGHRVDGSRYFDYHHTHADTIDKVDRAELSRSVAVMAAVAYILADMPGRLGERASR